MWSSADLGGFVVMVSTLALRCQVGSGVDHIRHLAVSAGMGCSAICSAAFAGLWVIDVEAAVRTGEEEEEEKPTNWDIIEGDPVLLIGE